MLIEEILYVWLISVPAKGVRRAASIASINLFMATLQQKSSTTFVDELLLFYIFPYQQHKHIDTKRIRKLLESKQILVMISDSNGK